MLINKQCAKSLRFECVNIAEHYTKYGQLKWFDIV